MVRENERIGITGFELTYQRDERLSLGCGASVAGRAVAVETALVADADAVPVVVAAVSSDLSLGASCLDSAVTPHHVVVTYTLPAAATVPLVYLLSAGGLARTYSAAVDDE